MRLKIAHMCVAVSMFISAIVLLYVDGYNTIPVSTQQSLITAWGVVVLLTLAALYFYYKSYQSVRTKTSKSKTINWIVCVLLFLSVTLIRGFEVTLFKQVYVLYIGMILSVVAVVLSFMVETKKVERE